MAFWSRGILASSDATFSFGTGDNIPLIFLTYISFGTGDR